MLSVRPVDLVRRRRLGVARVGDIQVDSDSHTYLLNGRTAVHNCSFCKESILARNFTQTVVVEPTGIIEFDWTDPDTQEKHTIRIEAKCRVKFWDEKLDMAVIGPIQVPLANGMKIAKESLRKLTKKDLFRTLSE